jgi:hypothetical protein
LLALVLALSVGTISVFAAITTPDESEASNSELIAAIADLTTQITNLTTALEQIESIPGPQGEPGPAGPPGPAGGSGVVILQGMANHGAEIPVPIGYDKINCAIIVEPLNMNIYTANASNPGNYVLQTEQIYTKGSDSDHWDLISVLKYVNPEHDVYPRDFYYHNQTVTYTIICHS